MATTGHEWDGIKELNTPLPRWWLMHLLRHHRLGGRLLDRLSGLAADHQLHHGPAAAIRRAPTSRSSSPISTRSRGAKMVALGAASLAEIEKDPELLALRARRRQDPRSATIARRATAGRRRRQGYPNLNDDDWLWGGTLDADPADDHYGIRSGHAKARDRPDAALRPRRHPEAGRRSSAVADYVRVAVGPADRHGL